MIIMIIIVINNDNDDYDNMCFNVEMKTRRPPRMNN